MRNVPAIECKPERSKLLVGHDENLHPVYHDNGYDFYPKADQPGAYRLSELKRYPDGVMSPVVSVCCPCGCGVHAVVFADPPEGNPPSMSAKLDTGDWKGQLLNGVWTEDGDGASVLDRPLGVPVQNRGTGPT